MKKIIFTLLGLLMITSASAEENEYVPLVREGVVWEYVGDNQGDYWSGANTDHYKLFSLYTLEFNGTTTIDGKLYHNIYRTDYDEQGNAQEPFFVAYVREENKVVTVFSYTYEEDDFFFYNYWWMMPKTLYDFSKPMFLPDEAFMAFGSDGPYNYNTDHVINGFSSIEVEVGGTIRKGFFIDNDEDSFKTIEGIGVDCNFGDLLVPYRDYITSINPMASLSAVYENGELVYKGRAYDEAQQQPRRCGERRAIQGREPQGYYLHRRLPHHREDNQITNIVFLRSLRN